jgi:leucyl-tRNA synthetase
VAVDPRTGDQVLRRETHRLLAEIEQLIQGQRFNVAVARIMELVNATRKVIDSGVGGNDPAVREAVEVIAIRPATQGLYVRPLPRLSGRCLDWKA